MEIHSLITMIVMMFLLVMIHQVQVCSTWSIGSKASISANSKHMTMEVLKKTRFTMVSQPHLNGNYQIFESPWDYLLELLIYSPTQQTSMSCGMSWLHRLRNFWNFILQVTLHSYGVRMSLLGWMIFSQCFNSEWSSE
jgi:hypothetical protein